MLALDLSEVKNGRAFSGTFGVIEPNSLISSDCRSWWAKGKWSILTQCTCNRVGFSQSSKLFWSSHSHTIRPRMTLGFKFKKCFGTHISLDENHRFHMELWSRPKHVSALISLFFLIQCKKWRSVLWVSMFNLNDVMG